MEIMNNKIQFSPKRAGDKFDFDAISQNLARARRIYRLEEEDELFRRIKSSKAKAAIRWRNYFTDRNSSAV